jgi:hypothetical protein
MEVTRERRADMHGEISTFAGPDRQADRNTKLITAGGMKGREDKSDRSNGKRSWSVGIGR